MRLQLEHYLVGLIESGTRREMIMQRGRNLQGDTYVYFVPRTALEVAGVSGCYTPKADLPGMLYSKTHSTHNPGWEYM